MYKVQLIRQSYVIHAPIAVVWQAMVDPQIIAKWGAGPAKMDDNVGTKFSLWGGDIHGKNIDVVKRKRLVQEWYTGKWDKPSHVHIALNSENGITYVDLLHEDVPDGEKDEINKGWKNFYFVPLKNLVEKSLE